MGGHHARHHRGVSAPRLGSNSGKIVLAGAPPQDKPATNHTQPASVKRSQASHGLNRIGLRWRLKHVCVGCVTMSIRMSKGWTTENDRD